MYIGEKLQEIEIDGGKSVCRVGLEDCNPQERKNILNRVSYCKNKQLY